MHIYIYICTVASNIINYGTLWTYSEAMAASRFVYFVVPMDQPSTCDMTEFFTDGDLGGSSFWNAGSGSRWFTSKKSAWEFVKEFRKQKGVGIEVLRNKKKGLPH